MANKILICDDDQIITDSLSEYLSAMDYEILAVNDGNEAIENFLSYNLLKQLKLSLNVMVYCMQILLFQFLLIP